MAYTHTAVAPRISEIPQEVPRAKRGFFQRLLDAIEAHTMRKAEAEIARYLGPRHKFTDETEREIERRFLSNR